MLQLSCKYTFQDYLFTFLLLQFTCVPYWTGHRFLYVVLILIAFYHFYRRKDNLFLDNKFIVVVIIYTFIAIIQGFIWGFSIISLLSSLSFTYLLSYLIYKNYKMDFFILLEKVFFGLAFVSTIIWVVQNLIPSSSGIINKIILVLNTYSGDQWPRSMLIYTYWDDLSTESYPFTRNAGFLHEPGAFAVFIGLSIIINILKGLPLMHSRNLIYFFMMLSTQSTAGYISLSIIFLLLVTQHKQRILSLLILPILVLLSVYSYNNLEFMRQKIESHVEEETNRDLNEVTTGRIYGARKSINVLKSYPFFGRSLNSISQPDSDSPEYAEYGWISYISRFGLFFGAIFMILFVKGIYNVTVNSGFGFYEFIIITSFILFSLSSQSLISTPFFLSFFYIGIYNLKTKYDRESL